MCNNFNKKFIDEASKALEVNHSNSSQEAFHEDNFMKNAIELAINGVQNGEGGPFGCVIVKDGKIIGKGNNKVTSLNDPTAHAEVMAIRDACNHLNSFQLDGCIVYTSCEPCPMCLGAIYWARPAKVFYACNKKDAAAIGFDDDFIYKELDLDLKDRNIQFEQKDREEALIAFKIWEEEENKTEY